MARPKSEAPKMFWWESGDCWAVKINGQRYRLGKDREKAEAKRRQLIGEALLGSATYYVSPATSPRSVNEALVAYRTHAVATVSPKQLARIDAALEGVRELYGLQPVDAFDQLALQAVRTWLLERPSRRGKKATPKPLSRNYVNHLIASIKTAWKWLVSQKLAPAGSDLALRSVGALRRGRGGREVPDVLPASPEAVAATIPQLNPVLGSMVLLLQLTGMRPGEVCILRPRNVSRSPTEPIDFIVGETRRKVAALEAGGVTVWVYAPEAHKTSWRGKPRLIVLGPKAQAVLQPFLEDRNPDAYCFSPREAMDALRTSRGQKTRYGKGREPGARYTSESLGRAIAKASAALGCRFTPGMLRHSAATEINEAFDLHTASAVLGHTMPDTTLVYALEALKKAAKAAAAMG